MPRASLKQRKDGRYCAKYKGRQFLGTTQSEACHKRDAYKKQIEAGLRAEAGGTLLSEYASQWVFTYKSSVSKRVYDDHVRVLNSFIAIIGDKPLRDVYPIDIQKAYNQQAGKGKSHIRQYRQTLNAMFTSAVNNRLILSNPCLSSSAPKGDAGTHRAIDPWERELIFQSEHRFKPAVLTMLYAGLRRGEVLALNIDHDVDYKKKTITVHTAVRYDSNRPILSSPKTEAGSRTIPLPDILAEILKPLHGLVAPSAQGGLMSEAAFTRAWKSYITHLEQLLNDDKKRWYGRRPGQDEKWIKEHPWRFITIRTHDLRHSYCTMLFDAGVDVKTAQRWMGHRDIATTMRIYTHLSAERESRSLQNFHDFMGSSSTYGMQNGMQTEESIENTAR